MTDFKRIVLVVLGVVALAVPTAAVAKHGQNHGKAKGKNGSHRAAYIFKGFYAGDSSVDVKRGNSRVRKGGFVGETVDFDLSSARFVVRDTNEDKKRNLDDVQEGDWVLVKARLPRKDPGSQPFEARRLVDKTNHPGKSKGKGKGARQQYKDRS